MCGRLLENPNGGGDHRLSFTVPFSQRCAIQKIPTVSTVPKRATALAGKFNDDMPSTDNRHPLRLLLEIEEVIRVDVKRRLWGLRVRSDTPLISLADLRNGILRSINKEGEGWDGHPDSLGYFVKSLT